MPKVLNVEIEIDNHACGYRWRFTKGEEKSEWFTWYKGISTYKFKDGTTWCYLTDYFKDCSLLPTEKPFQVLI